ncbi:bifunctional demethylmenaquinone methyltransferase/2-methoxy-6-polyprenyl-1,4-benzoquinol methylase UbiE [Gammaproteobacteria bacterium]|nr:bifunctional demethylmenaquinone methyltransferase/2-methoxy-6-polyprenyl-1,4-benzoquinol methylase UbiE [Gammaproteobacteria bacterium]
MNNPFDRDKKTHFGFSDVPYNEKANKVADVFHSVAPKYDIMNDFMSFGMHRLWKKFTISHANIRPGQKVLDIACGTGDLSIEFSKLVGKSGLVILSDINNKMLAEGRDRLTNKGIISNVEFIQADAECLPFKNNEFDCITIAFGLRNVTDKNKALKSIYRILKPGGKLLILEFSKPKNNILKKIYDKYSFNIIPKIGKFIANDEQSYKYLVESIRMHPDQEKLKEMMENASFEDNDYFNLTGGIVALHKGFKY